MSAAARPPRLLTRALAWMVPARLRDEVLRDMAELYRRRRRTHGPLTTRLWYVRALFGYLRLRTTSAIPGTVASESRTPVMSCLLQDIRFAARSLRRSPGFVLVVAVTLGLGVGVNTAVFSLVNAVLLRPLPVPAPEELVEIYSVDGAVDTPVTSSYPDYRDLAERVRGVEGIAGHAMMTANWRQDDRSSLIYGELVSGNYFDLFRVHPLRGRLLGAQDDVTPGGHPVAVVGYRFWQDRLAGREDVLGTTLVLNGTPYTVVGVAPADFPGMMPTLVADVFVPAMMATEIDPIGVHSVEPSPSGDNRIEHRGDRWLMLEARLLPGVGLEQVADDVEATMADLSRLYPETNRDWGGRVVAAANVRIHPMADGLVSATAAATLVMVGLVLLIACVNLAGMSLARANGRGREVAVRAALGAGRLRLLSQMLTESLLLATLGGALGLGLAVWVTRALMAAQPPIPVPLNLDLGIDGRVLAFTFGLTVFSAIASGLGPALQASRRQLGPALRDGRGGTPDRTRMSLRNVLVVAQVAICVILLVGAFLLVRSVGAADSIDLGFDPDGLAVLGVDLGLHRYDGERARSFFEEAVPRLRAIPGVTGVGLASRLPLSLGFNVQAVYLPGHQLGPDDHGYQVDAASVDAGYFDALGVRLLEGRAFTGADTPDTPSVALVSRTLAERYWPDGAVGRTFRTDGVDGHEYEIVGVVTDTKVRTVGEDARPYLYYCRGQFASTSAFIALRFNGDAETVRAAARRELLALEPELVFTQDTTMRGLLGVALFPVRVAASLLGSFGILALILAAVGLYGVIAYAVSRRTREIGIRMAMGAHRGDVRAMVLRQGLIMVIVGVILGVVGAGLLAGGLSGVLYGIGALDPIAFIAAVGVLLLVAGIANLVPAMRATRVDPVTALRSE